MIHIAFCTDKNYVMPTGVAMISVCENNRDEKICFHMVINVGDVTPSSDLILPELRKIAEQYNALYNEYYVTSCDLNKFGNSKVSHISLTTYARFFFPDLLPLSIEKVIYIDGDVCVNESLRDLWHTPLTDYCPLAAVPDVHGYSAVRRLTISYDSSEIYYNAGVLLINLKCWRDNNIAEKCIAYGKEKAGSLPMMDQDVINAVLGPQIKRLSFRYNFISLLFFEPELYWMIPYEDVEEIRHLKETWSPVIIHYGTPNKPWKDDWCPMREIWEKYEALSPWAGQERQSVITRFDRTTIYIVFIKAYWSDPDLFKKSLLPFIKLFNIAVKMKNKALFMKIGVSPMSCFSKILSIIYSFKTRR